MLVSGVQEAGKDALMQMKWGLDKLSYLELLDQICLEFSIFQVLREQAHVLTAPAPSVPGVAPGDGSH